MAASRSGSGDASSLFDDLNALLERETEVALSGLPNLTTQSYILTRNPGFQGRVVFWLLSMEELNSAQKLLEYWHRIYKVDRPTWILDELTPIRLQQLSAERPQIVLVDLSSIDHKIPSLQLTDDHRLTITTGDQLQPATLSQRFIKLGYEFSSHASEPGYFARRGGVVDVYPVAADQPVRIECSGSAIERMQTFNPIDKRLTKPVVSIEIIAKKFHNQHARSSVIQYFDQLTRPLLWYNEITEPPGTVADWEPIERALRQQQRVIIKDFDKSAQPVGFEHAPLYHKEFDSFIDDVKAFHKRHWRIAIATQQEHALERLFKDRKLSIPISVWPLLRELSGFRNEQHRLLVLTDREIFGDIIEEQLPRKRVDQAFIMELQPGDYIVHLDHGIGQFTGMAKNVVEGITKEYFILEYAEKDKLYVPVETADKISKYIGIANPKLHRLSGGQWYQLTRKVKQEAKVLAQELLKIYARREMTKIKPFTKDTPEEIELATSFPYKETPDQAKAIAEVKSD